MRLDPRDADYPSSLCHLDEPPTITVSGPLTRGRRVVAIIGSRNASLGAGAFTHALAYHLARAGVIVASGGAKGIDTMAHRGALQAGGTTWCVACCGRGRVFPPGNRELFAALERSDTSRMLWPFPDGTPKDKHTPRFRNGVLVALAECVIVVQAALRSGSRNAATWARRLGRRLVLVPGMPWDVAYEGTMMEGARGGEVMWSIEHLFAKLGLPPPDIRDVHAAFRGIMPRPASAQAQPFVTPIFSHGPLLPVDEGAWSDDEKKVFSILSKAPTQQDTVVERSGLPTSSTLTALLTLSLKDVVVEGPDGFFRRRVGL